MHALTRAAIFITVMTGATFCLAAQQQKNGNLTGSITGHVTIGGKPAPNIAVMLMTSGGDTGTGRTTTKASADREGLFEFTRLPAGRYQIVAFAPAYFSRTDEQDFQGGKTIMLSDGESVEGINISLKRGGVITGRITDARGRPLVQQYITLASLDEQGRTQSFYSAYYRMMQTDDRGIYRVYGLPSGRYQVSVGVPLNQGHIRMGYGNTYYPITYHPGVMDESKATTIEVTSGGEAKGVDIVVGRIEKAYTLRGRVVDADTGKPMANQVCGYGYVHPYDNYISSVATGAQSDDKGEFRIESIVPGKFVALAMVGEGGELYADPAPFEITDNDVDGIEIKIHRGASISGAVVIEGLSEQEAAAKFSEINLMASVPTAVRMFRRSGTKVNPDGSFRITGVQPGKAQIAIHYSNSKGISLLRVERDGVEQRESIEVAAGESVSGVKVFVAYGTGIIRGQVKVEGSDMPTFLQIMAVSRPAGEGSRPIHNYALIDARGRFVFEGLTSGEYELYLNGGSFDLPGGKPLRMKTEKQTVVVTNGAETEVTLVLEQAAKDR
ncbi:MAG TPA: carboxypeptidase-like regulatory domain-containing protein [Blastocatellia bacterium]|nr:carboxypeptidase-like regulatory domain-containing protein [Blastocatellia bacterium]